MNTLGERITSRMEELGITSQASLARNVGMSAPALTKIITGLQGDLKASNLLSICKFLRCRPEWLLTGKGSKEVQATNDVAVPVISWEQIVEFISHHTPPPESIMMPCPGHANNASFCLRVTETTMLPRFHVGDYIFIDTAPFKPQVDNYLLVKSERTNTPQLKQFFSLDGTYYLKMLNPDLPPESRFIKKTVQDEIIGRVIASCSIFED